MERKTRKVSPYQEITDTELSRFINNQSPKTKKCYTCYMRRVLDYTHGETGLQMLKEHNLWNTRILAFYQDLISLGYSENSASSMCGMVRGFFASKGKKYALDLRQKDAVKLDRNGRRNEDFVLNKEILKTMMSNGSQREKLVLALGCSFGLRAEDAIKITFGRMRQSLSGKSLNDCPISAGTINTGKENVKANLFISSDLFPIVEAILQTNPQAKNEDPIINVREVQLTSILQNLAKRSGIDTFGQHLRFHCCRAFLYSQLSSVGSEQNAKLIVGKLVNGSDKPYLHCDLRETYKKVESRICVSVANGELKEHVKSLEDQLMEKDKKIQELEDKLKTQTVLTADNASATHTHDSMIQELIEANKAMTARLEKLEKVGQ